MTTLISAHDIYTMSEEKGHKHGEKGEDKYFDSFRYAQIGAGAATAGKLMLAPVPKTNHHNVAATTALVAGKKKITLTLGATAAVANEYSHGMLVANDNSPEGEVYRISGHPAADLSTSLELTLEAPIVSTVTTASEFTLVHNRWNGTVEGTVVTQRAAGVPVIDVTAAYHAWLKTKGTASVLIGTAATLGADLIVGGTAGSVTDRTDNLGASSEPVVAVADIVLGVSTEYSPVTLCID